MAKSKKTIINKKNMKEFEYNDKIIEDLGLTEMQILNWENSMKKRNDIEFLRIEKTEALPNNKLMVYYAYNPIGKDEFKGTKISTDVIKFAMLMV